MDEPVVVHVVPNESEAELIRGLLKSAGIESTYRQSNYGAGAFDGMPGGAQEVLVRAQDVPLAREVLGQSGPSA
jgi:hypothetical protein